MLGGLHCGTLLFVQITAAESETGGFSFCFCVFFLFFFSFSAASRIVSGERHSQAEAGGWAGESCAEMSAEVMIVENMHLILPGVSPS